MGRLQRKRNTAKVKKNRKKSNKDMAAASTNGSARVGSVSSSLAIRRGKRYGAANRPVSAKRSGNFFSRALTFLKETKLELKKVVWPSRKQAISSTFLVIAVVSVISLFLGIIDVGLSGIIRVILG